MFGCSFSQCTLMLVLRLELWSVLLLSIIFLLADVQAFFLKTTTLKMTSTQYELTGGARLFALLFIFSVLSISGIILFIPTTASTAADLFKVVQHHANNLRIQFELFLDDDFSMDPVLFPNDIPFNYANVTRKSDVAVVGGFGSPEFKIAPKIKNGHHCPFLGFHKHSHYMLAQTVLPTLCLNAVEREQYCNVDVVRGYFDERLSPQTLYGFNRDHRVRTHLFPQCCDNFDFMFNFNQRFNMSSPATRKMLISLLPKSNIEQLKAGLNFTTNVELFSSGMNWNALNILDFIQDERTKQLMHLKIPEILYEERRMPLALKYGLWSHEFTKYGTCVTNQIYYRYANQIIEDETISDQKKIREYFRRVQLVNVWKSDPQLYYDLLLVLNKKLEYFRKRHRVLLKNHFVPSLKQTYLVGEIKDKIKDLFDVNVTLSCVWSSSHNHPLLYQFLTCLKVEDVEPLAFYLLERRHTNFNETQPELFKDVNIKKILANIGTVPCSSVLDYNRTFHHEKYFHNHTDFFNHLRFDDESNLLHGRECLNDEKIYIPDGSELLEFYQENEEGKIVKIDSASNTNIFDQEEDEDGEVQPQEDDFDETSVVNDIKSNTILEGKHGT